MDRIRQLLLKYPGHEVAFRLNPSDKTDVPWEVRIRERKRQRGDVGVGSSEFSGLVEFLDEKLNGGED